MKRIRTLFLVATAALFVLTLTGDFSIWTQSGLSLRFVGYAALLSCLWCLCLYCVWLLFKNQGE